MTTSQPPASSPRDASASPPAFSTLEALSPVTLDNLQRLGYLTMTPIQAASLPLSLAGRDLIAQAHTGSGKTAAFGLPLLANLNPRRFAVQSLVLCPTRELADQVTTEIRRLARSEASIKVLTLCGGGALRPQLASLAHGAHIVVGTPGRIQDLLTRGHLQLDALNTVVLDEADRMLDMGFIDEIDAIIQHCPKARQTLLFSATYPEGIAKLCSRLMRDPAEVKLLAPPAVGKIRQRFIEVGEAERLHAVSLLLNHYRPVSTLAFCNTKQQCRDLVEVLRAQGFAALELHGDLDQRERDQVMVRFANRSCSVLVATDLAARGLDIAQLEAVINVDISPDAATHTHRIGRTGRADEAGWAFSLASMDEMGWVGNIEHAQGGSVEWQPLSELQAASSASSEPLRPPMRTLHLMGGRKEKIRPGDLLGALTKDCGFAGAQIGKINVNEVSTYVAVEASIAKEAVKRLSGTQVKGRRVKVRLLED